MMKKMFVLNAGLSIRMGWKAVDLILSDATRKKIVISSKPKHKELDQLVEKDQLETKFGGSIPDKS